MSMDAQGLRHIFAVSGLAAGYQIQGVQPLPLLEVRFTFHASQ
jgi:hypothetical protein